MHVFSLHHDDDDACSVFRGSVTTFWWGNWEAKRSDHCINDVRRPEVAVRFAPAIVAIMDTG
jgi:hypothetical protein